MRLCPKKPLPLLVALALSPAMAIGQAPESGAGEPECADVESGMPGLYVTVDQSQVYLIQGEKYVELKPGEAAYAGDGTLTCIKSRPQTLDWPCGTATAQGREKADTYAANELPSSGIAQEVARRYFEENRVIGPPIEWLNGEYHLTLSASEIRALVSDANWYRPAGADPFASPKRPHSQLISLFWSTQQVLTEAHTIDALVAMHGEDAIPVVFVFHPDHEVPLSYFEGEVDLQKLLEVRREFGIELAPVPIWYVGDHHLTATVAELERFFEIPALQDIDPETLRRLTEHLEAYGFQKKPIGVTFLADGESMIIDQPARVRAAAALGITDIPIFVTYYQQDSILNRCGAPMPQISLAARLAAGGAGAESGEGSDAAAPTPPNVIELGVPLPRPEDPASGG